MKKFKNLIALLLVAVMVFALVACGEKDGETSKDNTTNKTDQTADKTEDDEEKEPDGEKPDDKDDTPKGKVVFWGGQFGSDKIFEKFKEDTGWDYEYPLNWVDDKKLIAACASGAPPDAAFLYASYVPKLAAANLLQPYDKYAEEGKIDWGKYYDFAVDLGLYNGKHYSLPWDINGQILYYNKKLFEQAGLDPNSPPKTWDELKDYAKKLTKFDSKGQLIQQGFLFEQHKDVVFNFAANAEAGTVSTDPFEVKVNTPQMMEIWEMQKELCELYGGEEALEKAKNAGVQFGLESDTVAMKLDDAIWPAMSYDSEYPDLDYGVAPVPTKNGEKFSMGVGATWALVIPVKSKNPEGGFAVTKWFSELNNFEDAKEGFESDPDKYFYMPIALKEDDQKIISDILPQIPDPKKRDRTIARAKLIGENGISGGAGSPVDFGEMHKEQWEKFYKGEMSAQESLAEWEKRAKETVETFLNEQKAMGIEN